MDAARNASAERLSDVAGLARPVSMADEQSLPVGLGGGACPRGAAARPVQGGPGTNALALALMAGASGSGSWVAAVGMPSLGIASAAEMGVVLERLVLVAAPVSGRWPAVVASLIDSFDLVLVNWPDASAAMVRRLGLRTRDRRAVLISVASAGRGQSWHEGADVRLTVRSSRWEGLGSGHGRLTARRLEVETSGRRSPVSHSTTLWLPDKSGQVTEQARRKVDPVPLGDGAFQIG